MSTPTAAEVEQRAQEARGERAVAVAAAAYQKALDEAYGDLAAWDQGYVCAVAESASRTATRYGETADLHERVVKSMRAERASLEGTHG